MTKELSSILLETLRLRNEGNLFWGEIDSYGFIINNNDSDEELTTKIYFSSDPSLEDLDDYFESLKFKDKIKSFELKSWGVTATIESQTAFESLFFEITKKLTTLRAVPICPNCNSEKQPNFIKINGKLTNTCHECTLGIETALEQEQNRPNNYLRGSIGALIGALIGSAAWIIIGLLNFYASIAGYVIAAASYKGYQTLGGKRSKPAIAIVIISVILSMFFAEYVSAVILVIKANPNGSVLDSIKFSFELLKDGTLNDVMLPGLGIGLLFAGLGSRSVIKDIKIDSTTDVIIERV